MLPLGEPAPRWSGPQPLAEAESGDLLDAARTPATVLTGWLRETAAGDDLQPRLLRLADGRVLPLPVSRWAGPADEHDGCLLDRATGPVLDVGCGPGRLTAALHDRGVEVLGLELVEQIPVRVRAAGAPLVVGDVFGAVPRAGSWRTVLLADGNIGIGGDVVRLLRRVGQLLAPGGAVLVELHPGGELPTGQVRLEGLAVASAWFGWAALSLSELPGVASTAGLVVHDTWSSGGRMFADLRPAATAPRPATTPRSARVSSAARPRPTRPDPLSGQEPDLP